MLKIGNPKHGKRYTKEYEAWQHMKSRCLNPKNKAYHNYGGRGISVCERWLTFENFFDDMGLAPSPEHSLDRYPNNNGNYEPNNCRWATKAEQQLNKRPRMGIGGISITKISKKLGGCSTLIGSRLKNGWPPQIAASAPLFSRLKSVMKPETKNIKNELTKRNS